MMKIIVATLNITYSSVDWKKGCSILLSNYLRHHIMQQYVIVELQLVVLSCLQEKSGKRSQISSIQMLPFNWASCQTTVWGWMLTMNCTLRWLMQKRCCILIRLCSFKIHVEIKWDNFMLLLQYKIIFLKCTFGFQKAYIREKILLPLPLLKAKVSQKLSLLIIRGCSSRHENSF